MSIAQLEKLKLVHPENTPFISQIDKMILQKQRKQARNKAYYLKRKEQGTITLKRSPIILSPETLEPPKPRGRPVNKIKEHILKQL